MFFNAKRENKRERLGILIKILAHLHLLFEQARRLTRNEKLNRMQMNWRVDSRVRDTGRN